MATIAAGSTPGANRRIAGAEGEAGDRVAGWGPAGPFSLVAVTALGLAGGVLVVGAGEVEDVVASGMAVGSVSCGAASDGNTCRSAAGCVEAVLLPMHMVAAAVTAATVASLVANTFIARLLLGSCSALGCFLCNSAPSVSVIRRGFDANTRCDYDKKETRSAAPVNF